MEKNEFKVFGAIEEIEYELPDRLQWDLIYTNNLSIEKEEMIEAVNILRKLQDEHDSKFIELASSLGID